MNRIMKNLFIKTIKLTVGAIIGLTMLSNSNAMYGDRDDFTDGIPTAKLPEALKEAKMVVKEERRDGGAGLEIAQDKVDAVKAAMKDRKADAKLDTAKGKK